MNEETLEEFKERIRTEYGPMYYDRQGKEMTLMEWAIKCEDREYKIVKQEEIGRYFVSTVWIGLNMEMFRQDPKQIFETMIFFVDDKINNDDDPLYLYQERYSTEEQAIKGHEEALVLCRQQLLKEQQCREEENVKDSQSADLAPST